MFVTRAKYDSLLRRYQGETKRRQEAEELAASRSTAITSLQQLIEHHRDQKPDAPVSHPRPADGDARLRQQLRLSEKARAALDADRAELLRINDQLNRQNYDRAVAAEGSGS
jgi:hypothetical protein